MNDDTGPDPRRFPNLARIWQRRQEEARRAAVDAELAARVIEGAHRGSLILTLEETRRMLETFDPKASVIVDGNPVAFADLPVLVIDNLDPFLPAATLGEAWNQQLVASFSEGLLDADDVERLWKR